MHSSYAILSRPNVNHNEKKAAYSLPPLIPTGAAVSPCRRESDFRTYFSKVMHRFYTEGAIF
jgi:hypothetical protein